MPGIATKCALLRDGAPVSDRLHDIVRQTVYRPVPPAVAVLGDSMKARFGDSLLAVIFYGSCLRSGNPRDGLVDLYVIVSDYAAAFPGWRAQMLARWVPPTVSYTEIDTDAGPVRAKYAVLSLRDFRRGTSSAWFHPYLWGRFAQPCRVDQVRDPETGDLIVECLANAARTLFAQSRPLLDPDLPPTDQWARALAMSYATELRPESEDRSRALVEADRDHYAAAWRALDTGSPPPPAAVRRARAAWAIRRRTGKAMSVLRWLKALATFEGGIDYAVWKLERHSGVRVEVPDRVRRRPWLYVWPELLRLYRQGVLR